MSISPAIWLDSSFLLLNVDAVQSILLLKLCSHRASALTLKKDIKHL